VDQAGKRWEVLHKNLLQPSRKAFWLFNFLFLVIGFVARILPFSMGCDK